MTNAVTDTDTAISPRLHAPCRSGYRVLTVQDEARVCLVVGNAHGGSTITNIMIGQHPEVFSAGSLRGFPHNGQLVAGNTCSCGEPASRCGLWSRVKDRVERVEDLGNRYRELYSSILEASAQKLVVDVDHGLTRLRELAGSPGLDLRIVYVRRSLAGLIHSQVRKSRERGELEKPVVDFIKLCLRVGRGWASKPVHVASFCDAQSIPYRFVNYEKLCSAPKLELHRIGDLLGLDYSQVGLRIRQDGVLTMPAHLIRGNRKLRQNKEIQLRVDDSWKSSRQYLAVFFALLGAAVGSLNVRNSMFKHSRQITRKFGS